MYEEGVKRMPDPKVSVIVLNHNGKKYLKTCLGSLTRSTYRDFETIFVDNASVDGSVKFVKENFPKVKILQNADDLGYAEGNNLAAKLALGKYIAFLSNDTEVETTWLEELVKTLESHPDTGVCGGKIYFYHNRNVLNSTGGLCDVFGYAMDRDIYKVETRRFERQEDVFWVSGSSIMIKREVFEKLGGFDSKFEYYVEDVDICWRAMLLGFRVTYVPRAIVYHVHGGKLTPFTLWRRYMGERNSFRMILKNYTGKSIARVVPLYLGLLICEAAFLFARGVILRKASYIRIPAIYLKALLWNLRNLRDTIRLRKEIQLFRTCSDDDIRCKILRRPLKLTYLRNMPELHQ
mgnify:CR=1 FL=1